MVWIDHPAHLMEQPQLDHETVIWLNKPSFRFHSEMMQANQQQAIRIITHIIYAWNSHRMSEIYRIFKISFKLFIRFVGFSSSVLKWLSIMEGFFSSSPAPKRHFKKNKSVRNEICMQMAMELHTQVYLNVTFQKRV